jgi:hypothetical protein
VWPASYPAIKYEGFGVGFGLVVQPSPSNCGVWWLVAVRGHRVENHALWPPAFGLTGFWGLILQNPCVYFIKAATLILLG